MKRPDRYFQPDIAEHSIGDVVSLDTREGSHAVRVKRRVPGAVIELFDGAGHHARAVITATDRRRGAQAAIDSIDYEPSTAGGIHLACAMPRGDRMETLLDMATQLGVTRISPLTFEYSTSAPGGGKDGRWRRVLVQACKQARRNHLPTLDAPSSYARWLADGFDAGSTCWLADPDGAPPMRGTVAACVVVVGPEGGLTANERGAARAAGFEAVSIGGYILRVETAAVAAVAAARIAMP